MRPVRGAQKKPYGQNLLANVTAAIVRKKDPRNQKSSIPTTSTLSMNNKMTKIKYPSPHAENLRSQPPLARLIEHDLHQNSDRLQPSGRTKQSDVWLPWEKKQNKRLSWSAGDALQPRGRLYPHWIKRVQDPRRNLVCPQNQIWTGEKTSWARRTWLRQKCWSYQASHEKQVRL